MGDLRMSDGLAPARQAHKGACGGPGEPGFTVFNAAQFSRRKVAPVFRAGLSLGVFQGSGRGPLVGVVVQVV